MICAIGSSQFLLGFQLAGVREAVLASAEDVLERVAASAAAVLIVEEDLLESVPSSERERLETSLRPLIVILGRSGTRELDRLDRLIKSTLGVSL